MSEVLFEFTVGTDGFHVHEGEDLFGGIGLLELSL